MAENDSKHKWCIGDRAQIVACHRPALGNLPPGTHVMLQRRISDDMWVAVAEGRTGEHRVYEDRLGPVDPVQGALVEFKPEHRSYPSTTFYQITGPMPSVWRVASAYKEMDGTDWVRLRGAAGEEGEAPRSYVQVIPLSETAPAPADEGAEEPGIKYDQGKPMFCLIPPDAELEVAKVLTHGAAKYSPENWRKVPDARQRYANALRRHLNAWQLGEIDDDDSGYKHMAHLATCALYLCAMDLRDEAGEEPQ
jgi:hypothetical protein